MQKIQPRGKYILIKPDAVDNKPNEFGLVIPKTVEQEQKAYGEVLAVGSEIKDIKKGDRVIFGMFAGEEIKMQENGKEVTYKLAFDEDVIAFLS
jgi:chaperonin GroES